jgi:hypothetical protein
MCLVDMSTTIVEQAMYVPNRYTIVFKGWATPEIVKVLPFDVVEVEEGKERDQYARSGYFVICQEDKAVFVRDDVRCPDPTLGQAYIAKAPSTNTKAPLAFAQGRLQLPDAPLEVLFFVGISFLKFLPLHQASLKAQKSGKASDAHSEVLLHDGHIAPTL